MTTPSSSAEQTAAVRAFVARWSQRGHNERGDTQPFWLDLLGLLGVDIPSSFIEFEDVARLDAAHGFIDGYIPATHVLVEQKKRDCDLRAPIRQSDGTLLTPFQQARRYAATLPWSQRPRWIVTCNFAEFRVYDMENPNAEPETIRLADLPNDLYRLHFLVNAASDRVAREMEVSIEAGRIVDRIYKALLAQYGAPTPEILHWLNVLCVRIVFCLYAEDADIFADDQFHEYLVAFSPEQCRRALLDLFEVLDTPPEKRSPYLSPALAAFPYVNGSLFSEPVEIPQFTPALREAILREASLGFDWADISPTIFGAVFESTLNPETRRSGGMHYTSIENIHKVIDPLFLDDLRAELDDALALPVPRQREAALLAYQRKLGSLTFLDPACGSGNFLTETYLSLRRLENQALAARLKGQGVLGVVENPVCVSIQQFHGIEINDFAVSVAKTALWIADSQMLTETLQIVSLPLDFLPLESYDGIVEGNALRMDWRELCSPQSMRVEKLNVEKSKSSADFSTSQPLNLSTCFSYIMGNPPFVGARMMAQGSSQKKDIEDLFGPIKDVQDLDYVCGWYRKAAQLIQGSSTRVGFVSTNSICQGSQVPILWNVLLNDFHVHIHFAHQTFKWNSESSEKAAVHCVIVGFGLDDPPEKLLFSGTGQVQRVPHISPYLFAGGDAFAATRKTPLCDVPPMNFGNQPRDGGHFVLSEDERNEILQLEPDLAPWIRHYIGAVEFIRQKPRFCFWLRDIQPADLKRSRILYERVQAVRGFRLASAAKTTRGYAKTPHLFAQITQPEGVDCLLVPRVSSERRRYVPMGFIKAGTVSSDAVQIVPGATLYHFGILTSNVHMAWMRTVCGRLKSDYRYSKEQVYNPFPWPSPTAAQKARIEQTAQAILDARAHYPGASLSDLYDEVTMPADLRAAHRANDRAVMTAYGFDLKMAESDCVAELFKLYQALTAGGAHG